MKVLEVSELLPALACPMCRGGTLQETGTGACCTACAQTYGMVDGVLSFLVEDQLSETNRNEIKGNTFTGEWVDKILAKEDWSPLLTHQMRAVVDLVCEMLPAGVRTLFTLGAGTGFDLRLLLRRRSFERVFASDIAPAATTLISRALAEYPGELGLFASEFSRAPIAKHGDTVGLVFQALHHAPDAHEALATLLDHNFDELVIVEPVTNPPLGALAKFDLVQRVEYTGTRPDWLSLPRVATVATERGYRVASSRTWWEIPPYFARAWIHERRLVWRGVANMFDAVSRATNMLKFGSMAAVHLTRS